MMQVCWHNRRNGDQMRHLVHRRVSENQAACTRRTKPWAGLIAVAYVAMCAGGCVSLDALSSGAHSQSVGTVLGIALADSDAGVSKRNVWVVMRASSVEDASPSTRYSLLLGYSAAEHRILTPLATTSGDEYLDEAMETQPLTAIRAVTIDELSARLWSIVRPNECVVVSELLPDDRARLIEALRGTFERYNNLHLVDATDEVIVRK